jgi:hypothetical protein
MERVTHVAARRRMPSPTVFAADAEDARFAMDEAARLSHTEAKKPAAGDAHRDLRKHPDDRLQTQRG